MKWRLKNVRNNVNQSHSLYNFYCHDGDFIMSEKSKNIKRPFCSIGIMNCQLDSKTVSEFIDPIIEKLNKDLTKIAKQKEMNISGLIRIWGKNENKKEEGKL